MALFSGAFAHSLRLFVFLSLSFLFFSIPHLCLFFSDFFFFFSFFFFFFFFSLSLSLLFPFFSIFPVRRDLLPNPSPLLVFIPLRSLSSQRKAMVPPPGSFPWYVSISLDLWMKDYYFFFFQPLTFERFFPFQSASHKCEPPPTQTSIDSEQFLAMYKDMHRIRRMEVFFFFFFSFFFFFLILYSLSC